MDGDIAKKIFANFLKENNLMWIAIAYYFGKPKKAYFDHRTNIQILNESAILADRSNVDDHIKKHLIDMVGKTRDPSIMFIRFKHDYILDIYRLWKNYIEKNWNKIYDKFYKNKRSLM